MSLLEELSAKGAPSRLIYDDEDIDEEVGGLSTSTEFRQNTIDPTTRFQWIYNESSSSSSSTTISTLMVVVGRLPGLWTQAWIHEQHASNSSHSHPSSTYPYTIGTLKVKYPLSYSSNQSVHDIITVDLPVTMMNDQGLGIVTTDKLTDRFPPELYTAVISSLLTPLHPTHLLTITCLPLTQLLLSHNNDGDDHSIIYTLTNNHANTCAIKFPRLPSPTTISDLAATSLVQATHFGIPGILLGLFVPYSGGIPDISQDTFQLLTHAVSSIITLTISDNVARCAQSLWNTHTPNLQLMYL